MWDERFEKILRSHLPFLPPDDALTEGLSLRDFGLDSIGTVELLSALESTYGFRFADDLLDMKTFATPGVLWASISDMAMPAN